MAEFAYNNAKKASISHTLFKLNYGYHPYIFYKKNVDPRFKSKLAKGLSTKLRELMMMYWKNLYHTKKL